MPRAQTCLKLTPVAHSYTFQFPFPAAPGTWRSKTRTCWSMLCLSRRAILSGMANSRCYRTLRVIYVIPFDIILLLSCVITHTLLLIIIINTSRVPIIIIIIINNNNNNICRSVLISSTPLLNTHRPPFSQKKTPGTDHSGTKLLKGFFGPDWW